MILYRADKRDFAVGDKITTAGDFETKNPDGSTDIEKIFESAKPQGKPIRYSCLFLFEDLTVAKKHWSKMADGKLYEVEIDGALILHKGDMRLVDEAFSSEKEAEKNKCASDYWSGYETDSPRIEVLVKDAIVTSVISKDQRERQKYLLNWPSA